MRHFFTLLTLFLLPVCHAQTGIVRGVIRSGSGQVLPDIPIALNPGNARDTSDASGSFRFSEVLPGKYTLTAVGAINASQKTIEVQDGETTIVELLVDESSHNLQEFVVSGEANRYRSDELSTSLRLNEPVLEIPQNIQTVSRSALDDQQVISMSDGVIRNVSGTYRAEHWADIYTNVNARGSQLQAFRNGFNVKNSAWGPLTEDMSMVDHIDFVKGPAGFMVAYGDPGGMYNVVTKKPTGVQKGEVSFTLGSYDLYRTAVDLDGKLSSNGKLLYRFNAAAQTKKSFRANEFNDRYTIAPVISYQLDKKTKLTFEYTYQRANTSNVGSYYVFSPNGYDSLPRNATGLPAGLDPTIVNDHSAYVYLEHQLNKNWKINAAAARLWTNQTGASMWPSAVNTDGTIVRALSSWDAKSSMSLGQVYLSGTVQTGGIQHRVLAGTDAQDKSYYADWGQYFVLDTAGSSYNYANPTSITAPYPVIDHSTPVEQRALAIGGTMFLTLASAYVQDELGFFSNRLRLTLAGRYTHVKQSNYGATVEGSRFTPRVGLSWTIVKNLAMYALYDQAFLPQTGTLSNGKIVQPITGDNWEIGFKKDWFGGKWNTTASVYTIRKNHELTADPFAPPASNLSIELGQKTAQGIEFDIRGNLLRGLNLIANYAYTESKVTKVADGISYIRVGDVVPGFNKHTANVWLTYRVSRGIFRGFGAAIGGTYLAGRNSQWDVVAGTKQLPDYLRLDGGLFWENRDLRVTANMFNIANSLLYSGSYYAYLNAYYTQYEAGRNVRLSISYKF